jgi:hypothetical protein
VRLLVSGCTDGAAAAMKLRPDRLGVLMTPRYGNRIPTADASGTVWAADNDCFQGLHPVRWLRFLAKILESGSRPKWVACPDAVGDAGETWRLYNRWAPVLIELGLPVALVLQDGLEKLKWRASLPSRWDELSAVFVGGSTEWKLSTHAVRLVREAKERGKWVHVGRVNSLKRISHFAPLGVDSFDGSGFSAWGDKRIKLAVRWIDRALSRPSLFDTHGAA